MNRDFWLYNMFRHQIAGLAAAIVDFGVTIFLTEVLLVWYGYSNGIGAFMGAITNFFISSFWAFAGSKNKLVNQLWKYILVSAGSLILNTGFVILFTEMWFEFDYVISKIIVALGVAWTFNFLLMRYYVFKK